MPGTGRTAASAARAPFCENESGQVGPGLGCGSHVFLACQSAHLDQWPRDELGELRSRVVRTHERRADEDRVGAGEFGRRPLGPRFDAALRDDGTIARRARDEAELRLAVDAERGEIARVDPDHGRSERDRALQLRRVVRLHERLEAELGGEGEQTPHRRVVEVAKQQKCGIGARFARSAQILVRREEPLCQERQRRRRTRGTQVVPGAAEALVDEYRHGGRAGSLVCRGDRSRIRIGTEVARRRRAALHLRDRGQPRPTQRLLETSHHGDSRENATSSSRRAAARPLSIASSAAASPSSRSAACPAAAIAPAALSATAARFAPEAPPRISRAVRAFSSGDPPTSSAAVARFDSELGGIDHALAHSAVRDLEHEVRSGRRQLVDAARAVHHERAARVEERERVGDRARDVRRIDAEYAGARACRVRQRPEHVEDRARSELPPHGRGMPHGRMVRRREHESESEGVDRLGNPLRSLLEREAERLEHVRGSGDGAHGAIAVLRDSGTRSGGDDRRRRRDVERARPVPSRTDDVDHVVTCRVHLEHVRAHRLGAARDLVRRLPLRAQRDEKPADLHLCRLSAHDLAHHLSGVVTSEVVPVEQRVDRGLDHRVRVCLTAATSRSTSASSLYGPTDTRASVVPSHSYTGSSTRCSS